MKSITLSIIASLYFASSSMAAGKTYQVTGPVLEMTDTSIIVDKGGEKWELAKDATTKITGELKVGSKITAKYKMIATDVEVKGDTKAADTKKKKK